MNKHKVLYNGNLNLFCGDALEFYDSWESPTVIISDGPYGVNGFPGDLFAPDELAEWYEPHVCKWSEYSTPLTTLWFWNTEVGWANVHSMLKEHGWEYVSCCIWDKGISHVAGNVNTKTIRHLPIVTEVCVQYVKKPTFKIGNAELTMKEWLRYEWSRTGLPFKLSNEACGVKDAATRKYFTKCRLWYMPPAEAFSKIAAYANLHGKEEGKPYFSIDGKGAITEEEWSKLRSKFYCPIGTTNVWTVPQLRNRERLKVNQKAIHLNQKPLSLIKQTIEMTSDKGDVVWDPFAGVFTTAVATHELKRRCYCSEINQNTFNCGYGRIQSILQQAS